MSATVENIIQKAFAKFKELGIDSINIKQQKSADASSFQKSKYSVNVKNNLIVEGNLEKDQKSKLSTVNKFLDELKDEVSKIDDGKTNLINKVSSKISIGDDFNTIEQLFDFEGNEKSLKHQEGQIMLIDFWATWCGPCQMPMQHNQDMLTKNAEKWGNKVNIVGLGMDDDVSKLKQKVNDKNWKKVTHYHVKGGFKHPACSAEYGITGIPHVALFDKKGKLLFKGHPSEVELEKWISCLVEDKEFVQKTNKKIGDKFDDIENCIDFKQNHHTIKHDGRVLMIDFWATWCGPCQTPMQHNQDMIVKNKQIWDGKVRIVGLSMDENLNDVKTRVEQKKWDAVEHYQLENGFENEVASVTYKVEGIPNIIIFDKDNKLVYQGHPSSIPLEETLTKLANGEKVDLNKKESKQEGNNNPLIKTNELFKTVESIEQKGGPLDGVEDSIKPWVIIEDLTEHFANGTHSQKVHVIRRQFGSNNETAKKFVDQISKLAKDQNIQVQEA